MKSIIRASKAYAFSRFIDLFIGEFNQDGQILSIAEPIKIKRLTEKESIAIASYQPALSIRPEAAQALMDDLWQCGLRPSEGTGSAGSLAATERHLKDMRMIAFSYIEAEGLEIPSGG